MKTVFKWLVYIGIALLAIATAAWFLLRPRLEEFLVKRLRTELKNTFGEYYHLDFTSIETGITTKSLYIRFHNPKLTTDTSQQEELKKYPPLYFKADSFEVNGINIRRLLWGSTLELESIRLFNPNLVVLIKQEAHPKNNKEKPHSHKRKLISEILLSKLAIHKGNISLLYFDHPVDTFYYGDEINLELSGVDLHTQSPEGIYRESSMDNLQFSMSNVHFSPNGMHYDYFMKSIRIDLKGDVFECHQMKLLPEKSLRKLSQEAYFQKTFAQISLGNLSFSGFDYNKLLDKELRIRCIRIDNGNISLLRNKKKQFDKSLVKQTLQSALKQMPIALRIDSVKISNMNLNMQILFPQHAEPAIIKLTGISGTLTDINSSPGSNQSIKMALNGHIMKTGKLNFNAIFPMHLETHQYKADVGAMPFNEWNDVISKIGNIRIDSGNIKRIRLSGNCTSDETNGRIIFEYQNLHCAVLRSDRNGDLKKSKLLSFGGNLLIRHDNPLKKDSVPLERPVYYKKQPYQGETVLWVGGMLDGMLATIFTEKVKQKIDDLKVQKQQNALGAKDGKTKKISLWPKR